jgi:NAD(P)-dependent dehydrogenase (short-subunit alcohol dehydrogenase family)
MSSAIVTGGASGLGRAIAIALAEAGHQVVIADLRKTPREGGQPTDHLIRQQGRQAAFIETDVTDEAQVEHLVRSTFERFGPLGVMCNNAGVSGLFNSLVDTKADDFDRIFRVNVRGVFLGSKYAGRQLIEQGIGGVIVNTASCFGLVGYPSMASYCATKGAVIQLTRALALELAPHRIRVNALCPGTLETEMDREQREDPDAGTDITFRTPLATPDGGYVGTPTDQAAAVVFLASDAAQWMTGQCLVIDGGWTAV